MMLNISSNISSCSCKGCKDRHIGCHGDCKKYAEFRRKTEKANKLMREQKKLDFDTTSEGWTYLKSRKRTA